MSLLSASVSIIQVQMLFLDIQNAVKRFRPREE